MKNFQKCADPLGLPGPTAPHSWGFTEEGAAAATRPDRALAPWIETEGLGFELSPREFWMSFLSSLTGRASNYESHAWGAPHERSHQRPGYSAPWSYEDCVQHRPDPYSFPLGEEDMEGLNYDEFGPPVLLWAAWPRGSRAGAEPPGGFYRYAWASSEEEALERLFPEGGERVLPAGQRPLGGQRVAASWTLKLLAAVPEGAGVRLERSFETVTPLDDDEEEGEDW